MSEKPDHFPDSLPGYYINRGPSAVMGIVSVLIALVLLAFSISELRRAGQGRATLTTVTGSENTSQVPVLSVADSDWKLNGSNVTESDLVFRLSGLSASAEGIVIEYDRKVSADLITKALNNVNQAGFSQVGMRLLDNPSTQSVVLP